MAGAEGYMTASSYPDDGVGEVFLKLGKQGSTLAGVMDAFSIAISVGLQYGIPLDSYVAKFTNMRFEPAGLTDDPDIRIASSVMDYIFRRLALDHLPYEERAELGILSAAERAAEVAGHDPAGLSRGGGPGGTGPVGRREQPHLTERAAVPAPAPFLFFFFFFFFFLNTAQFHRAAGVPSGPQLRRSALPPPAAPRCARLAAATSARAAAPPAAAAAAQPVAAPFPAAPHSSTELIESQQGRTADAPLCLTCGTKMRPAGSCYVCEGCGSTSGCS